MGAARDEVISGIHTMNLVETERLHLRVFRRDDLNELNFDVVQYRISRAEFVAGDSLYIPHRRVC